MNKVAVVILNWNGADMLRRFLPSVVACSVGDGVEVCVADNGSTDDSAQVVASGFPAVRWIPLGRNHGFAEGYNQAMRHVDAEYAVLLNSDVEVTPHWLDALRAYMDAHPEVAACQPKVRGWHHRDTFEYAGAAGGYIDALGYAFCRGRLFDVVEQDAGQYDEVRPVFWATGAAMFIRVADYRAVGGLDARFFAHQEEIDLCWRLRSRRRGVACVPQSVVYHVGGATLSKENPRKTFLNFRNNLLMIYKNMPEKSLRRVMAWRMWLDWLAAASFALKGNWADARAVLEARVAFRRLKPLFKADRCTNLQHASLDPIPEMAPFSLLFRYYVLRRRTYSQLRWDADEVKSE